MAKALDLKAINLRECRTSAEVQDDQGDYGGRPSSPYDNSYRLIEPELFINLYNGNMIHQLLRSLDPPKIPIRAAMRVLQSASGPLLARLATVCVVAISMGSLASSAFAEEAEAGATGGGGKSWAIPWLIVVLALALGIFITLRPAGRATEIKRDSRVEL